MTSRRQETQDRYDHILPFIEEAASEYYGGNLDRGFRHWAFATIFTEGYDVHGNDIVDLTAIDGSDDFEIDGYFIPESDDDLVVHLFQSKHRLPGTSMNANDLAPFLNAPNRILNANEVAASHNEETKALHDQIINLLATRGMRCTINLIWATTGRLTPRANGHIEGHRSFTINVSVSGNSFDVPITLECWDLDKLYDLHSTLQESDQVAKCDVEFQLEPGSFHQTLSSADYRTLSMTVPAKQIIDVFARHRHKLFRLNPRGPLGNKVNRSIKRTLLDEIERRRFHLLNNGITAICYSWALTGETLIVQDFQIINGCQTTVTMWDARAAVIDDPNVLVSVKLTECPEHFATRIAASTNNQAALRAEDFTSTEAVQIKLQQQFASLNPPWFYQVKRGEWSKMLGGQREKEPFRDPNGGYRQLNVKDVAQAVVSFAGYPGEAKDKIRNFLNKETVSSIARESEFSYDAIYTENLTAAQLLLPAVVQRYVWRQVTLDKPDKLWLEYGRFHIVWLIGVLLRKHYQLESALFPSSRAVSVADQIDDWFEPLYNVSVTAVQFALEAAVSEGSFTGYREFFRTAKHYRAMETYLVAASRMSSALGSAFADLLPN